MPSAGKLDPTEAESNFTFDISISSGTSFLALSISGAWDNAELNRKKCLTTSGLMKRPYLFHNRKENVFILNNAGKEAIAS